MSQTSPLLNLPFIQPAQAQKHVTHNEAVELLDMIVQLTVQAFDAQTPASNAVEGQTWALGDTPTGVWAGQAGALATWRGGGWLFVAPRVGWRAYDLAEAKMRVFDGAAWAPVVATPVLENLPGLGINATSDATNKLAVSSDATLLNHAGNGHQLKLNKASAGDTASLLYQSNFSGRAEMGLAGEDDFSIKVSADGSTFTQALLIDAATGHVDMPTSRTRLLIPYQYRHTLLDDRRWTAPTKNGASWNASRSLGTSEIPDLDWEAKGLFLPAGTVLHKLVLMGNLTNAEVPDLDLRGFFQHGPASSIGTSANPPTRDIVLTQDAIGWTTGTAMRRSSFTLSYTCPDDGYFMLATRATAGGTLTATQYAQFSGVLDVSCPR